MYLRSGIRRALLLVLLLAAGQASADYTQLEELKGYSRSLGYAMPAYDSPADGWEMIKKMCGPVGRWDHEISVPYSPTPYDSDLLKVKHLKGCVHIKGELGPNGELPAIAGGVGATRGYKGKLQPGGVFVENLKVTSVGVPNNKYFLVMHNMHFSNWPNHAFITSGGNKHMYLELLDSYLGFGNNNHAAYIDNIAFANIQRNLFESPGRMHAFRSIAQKSLIKNNTFCNIQCDGTVLRHPKGRLMSGMAPLEIYTNGEHLLEDNTIVYHRATKSSARAAANFRGREGINTLDRFREGDHYKYLVWGTPEYNNPQTWAGPMLDTRVKNLKITCYGVPPCHAWNIKSTYPYLHDRPKAKLLAWFKENRFRTWEQVLANSHPSWHGTLNLMTDSYKRRVLIQSGEGLPNKIPFPVPEGWQQKARITFENVTGNFEQLYAPVSETGGVWCAGAVEGEHCKNQQYFRQATVVQ